MKEFFVQLELGSGIKYPVKVLIENNLWTGFECKIKTLMRPSIDQIIITDELENIVFEPDISVYDIIEDKAGNFKFTFKFTLARPLENLLTKDDEDILEIITKDGKVIKTIISNVVKSHDDLLLKSFVNIAKEKLPKNNFNNVNLVAGLEASLDCDVDEPYKANKILNKHKE